MHPKPILTSLTVLATAPVLARPNPPISSTTLVTDDWANSNACAAKNAAVNTAIESLCGSVSGHLNAARAHTPPMASSP
ncbi:hypothetical protein Tdes44962_MAKER06219 [Teratosphaeria destructans]|uniref:Uncharacterized protein n=1 Tax=Teratosphaeria destructans TaxID=418781 RepID=A0A9W7SHW9_9PEZI|nr:hypothetical protein Tdes44962_MAKER06219 [Teratosphaeria destructans]